MVKAKSHPDQFGFSFDQPSPATAPAALAGLEKQINAAVGTILNSDSRPREVIAAQMTVLLGEDVSRAMLDAYSSPARIDHRVPFSRFLALVQICNRHDVLDQLLRPIGAAVLVGEEVHTARLGHLDQQISELQAERKRIQATAPLIRGGTIS